MKKIVACLLALWMVMSGCLALAESIGAIDPNNLVPLYGVTPVADQIGFQEGVSLTVGSTVELGGCFATEMWGSNSADLDVRALLHGYATIEWTRSMSLALNTVAVAGLRTQLDDANNRTYIFEINPNLTYNDGTPITAKDYVFSVLLSGAPQIAEVGGKQENLSHIAGFDAYRSGETNMIEGVRLLSGTSFSLTVTSDFLPYFYGLALLNVTPYPLSVIAPGCDVVDDGQGAYLAPGADAANMDAEALGFVPGEFSADMLRVTMTDPESGYLFNPRVTSGPYSLESFDWETRTATFKINHNYLGNYEGQKPHIESLTFTHVTNANMMEQLDSGAVQLLNKVSNSASVAQGLERMSQDIVNGTNYTRTGLAYLAFACEQGPTASVAVRQAIARCLDKQTLVNEITGPANGMPVHGYYGLGQWMVTQFFDLDTENDRDALDVQEQLNELAIARDLVEAERLLVGDGWMLNEAGEPFVKGADTLRFRLEEDVLVPLTIRWAKTKDNEASGVIERLLSEAFAELGIGLEITEMSFPDMLTYYFRQKERTFDLFFVADNFSYVFDPYPTFSIAEEAQGLYNTSGLLDEQLMELTQEMRVTEPTDLRGYVERWLAFQQRWVEMMPMVPLYSSVYFDFYPNDLQGYQIADHASWGLAIPYAWIGEPLEPEVPVVDEGEAVDIVIIDDAQAQQAEQTP